MNTAIIIMLVAIGLTLFSLPLDSNNNDRK